MARDIVSYKVEGMENMLELMTKFPERMERAKEDFLGQYGNYAFSVTQEACPVDQGILVASGELEVETSGFTITYTAPYAAAVEYGWVRTEPIVPIRKQALSWEAGKKGRLLAGRAASQGRRVVVARVDGPASFPGISYARVPLRRSLAYVKDFWCAAFKKHVKEAQ